MNEDEFVNGYFGLLCEKMAPYGYDSDELVKTIWAAVKAMRKNDGTRSNEQAFWDCFASIYGQEKLKDKALFEEFYRKEFSGVKIFCGKNPKAREVIDFTKAQKLKVILASNPLFPKSGMVTRLGFVGLNETDFDDITSYETAHYAKPNPNYLKEILKNNNLQPNEAIVFGNSEIEDCEPASSIGMKSFLVGDTTVLKGDKPIYQHIAFDEIKDVIQKEVKAKKVAFGPRNINLGLKKSGKEMVDQTNTLDPKW